MSRSETIDDSKTKFLCDPTLVGEFPVTGMYHFMLREHFLHAQALWRKSEGSGVFLRHRTYASVEGETLDRNTEKVFFCKIFELSGL